MDQYRNIVGIGYICIYIIYIKKIQNEYLNLGCGIIVVVGEVFRTLAKDEMVVHPLFHRNSGVLTWNSSRVCTRAANTHKQKVNTRVAITIGGVLAHRRGPRWRGDARGCD